MNSPDRDRKDAASPPLRIADILAETVSLGAGGAPLLALSATPPEMRAGGLTALPVAGIIFPSRREADAAPADAPKGWFAEPAYDWVLPPATARWILFLGPRRRLTAPMMRRAAQAGIRRIVYAGPLGWRAEAPWRFLGARSAERLAQAAASRIPVLEVAWGARVERTLAALLAAAQAAGPCATAAPGRIVLANYGLARGGSERQIVNTLIGLKEGGRGDLRLICERINPYGAEASFERDLESAGIPVQELPLLPDGRVAAALAPLAARYAPLLERLPPVLRDDVLAYAGLLLKHRPSVLHAWQDGTSIKAGLAAALAGVPRIVLAARNVAPPAFDYWLPWFRPAYRALSRWPGIVLTNNSRVGARDYERWLGLPEGGIRVVYNGLSPRSLEPVALEAAAAMRARLGLPRDAPLVGSVFRFYPEKEPLLWIETAARLAARRADLRFLLIGDGPLRAEAEAAAQRLGIADRVTFTGELEDPRAAVAALSVFLLTSRQEGLPNAVIEAQAQGVPAVVRPAGGAPEAIEAGTTGLVVDAAAAGPLAEAVLRVLGDPGWADAAGRRARTFARERFGIDRMLGETISLYGLGG